MIGLDYSWGRPDPKVVHDLAYRFVMRYLAYPPSGKILTADERVALHAAGLAVGLNWENKAGDMLGGYVSGQLHGLEAVRQVEALGAPSGITIFYSADQSVFTVAGSAEQKAMLEYLRGVREAHAEKYKIGIYGGLGAVKAALDAGAADVAWQTYGWSGGQWDPRAALRQVLNTQTLNGAQVDYDTGDPVAAGLWLPEGGLKLDAPNYTAYGTTPYANTTDAEYYFWRAFKAFEPKVQLGGIYANKAGFHNRGDALPDYGAGDSRTDYSIRDAVNRTGPYWKTKAAAIDLTFSDAQAGNYTTIAKYSKRLYNSGKDVNDPRLDLVMFDFYGQTDSDTVVEGWNELKERDASSDSSHLWHIHISLLRSKVQDFWAMWALLTVLMGWSVDMWRATVPAGTVPTPPPVASLTQEQMNKILNALPVLRVGSTDRSRIKRMQLLLNGIFGYKLVTDGIFGTGTLAAVKSWQSRVGRPVDGVFNVDDWAVLVTAGLANVLQILKRGSSGAHVKRMQLLLNGVFGYTLTPDGAFGPATETAVKNWQSRAGRTADGVVGADDWSILLFGANVIV